MTLLLTFGAFLGGILAGIPICMVRQSRRWVPSAAAGALIISVRSIPPLVWLFLIYFGLGSGILRLSPFVAALLGLALITAVNMAEIYRGSLAAIHSGQWEASQALGLPLWSRLVEIIGPQAARISLPAMATYAIGLLKDTALASTIGVPDLTFQGSYLSQQTFKGLEVFDRGPALHRDQPAGRLAFSRDRRPHPIEGGQMIETLGLWAEWLPRLLGGLWLGWGKVAGLSLLIGIPLGLVLALAVQAKWTPLRAAALVFVEVGRGTPALVLLQLTYFGLPNVGLTLATMSAALALGVCTGAYTSEIDAAGWKR